MSELKDFKYSIVELLVRLEMGGLKLEELPGSIIKLDPDLEQDVGETVINLKHEHTETRHTFELGQSKFNSTVKMLSQMAGESLRVEFSDSVLTAFGSELAILRIAKKYCFKSSETANFGYSKPYNSDYFTLQIPSFTGEYSTHSASK